MKILFVSDWLNFLYLTIIIANKKHSAIAECFLGLPAAEGLFPFAMAISTQKLINSGRIRLKRQRSYRCAAFAALPVALKHFAFFASLISIEIHICICKIVALLF